MEARGAVESAHRIRQVWGQIFRFAAASRIVERDVSADLKGALATAKKTNYAAITDPKHAGALMPAIYDYKGIRIVLNPLRKKMISANPGIFRLRRKTFHAVRFHEQPPSVYKLRFELTGFIRSCIYELAVLQTVRN
jgi:hypothetical protein